MIFHWYQSFQSYQWTSRMHPYSTCSLMDTIGTNTIGTHRSDGRVECTPTQPETNRNNLSPSMRCILLIEYQWNKCYSIGTNRTNRTNGRVECTPTQPEADGSPSNKMHSTKTYQLNKWYSIDTNCTNRTNGRVDCTPTQPVAEWNILTRCNEMHFTNGIPME